MDDLMHDLTIVILGMEQIRPLATVGMAVRRRVGS
jgi:hypothetical protein